MKKKRILFIILSIIFLQMAVTLNAEVEDGMMFKSYEVNPETRTSLRVPESSLYFTDSLVISFDIRILQGRERYGYICRLILDGDTSLDLLLSTPYKGLPFIGATGNSSEVVEVPLQNDMMSVNRVRIALKNHGDSIFAFVNGKHVFSMASEQRRCEAAALFGKNSVPGFESTDVAPMVISHLEVAADRRKVRFWNMSGDADLNKYPGFRLSAWNCGWMRELNEHWTLAWHEVMPSRTFILPCIEDRKVLFISEGKICDYSFAEMKVKTFHPAHRMNVESLTNDFVRLPDGRIAYLDVDNGFSTISLNAGTGDWSDDNPRKSPSKYLHHNLIYDAADSTFIHILGYGYHKYLNNVVEWNPWTGADTSYTLALEPRYLSAVGIYDGGLYIYGGKGNSKGVQELGTRIYNDFYRFDLKTGDLNKLWENDPVTREVAASDLVFNEDGTEFLALVYNPNAYKTSLQLRSFNVQDGSSVSLANPVPYNFLDVASEARLLRDEKDGTYYAVIVSKDENGVSNAYVYMLRTPILSSAQEASGKNHVAWYILVSLVLAGSAAVVFFRRKGRKDKSGSISEEGNDEIALPVEPSREPECAGVRLLGGFKVTDMDGEDITSAFSPLMKQLLSIMILYSYSQNGISNAELKDLLWFDKSDDSYNNNRGVNLKKIRSCLEKVGDAEIVSHNGRWLFKVNEVYCDYLEAMSALEKSDVDAEHVLSMVDRGVLLPEMRYDWLDQFKSEYSEKVISALERLRTTAGDTASAELAIRLSDAVLVFDSLDEDSIRNKCQALIKSGRVGSAKNVFSKFTDEYERVMGEKYPLVFSDFVKKQEH